MKMGNEVSQVEQREMGAFGAACVREGFLRSARSGCLLYFRENDDALAWAKTNIGDADFGRLKIAVLFPDAYDDREVGLVLKVPEWKDTYQEPLPPAVRP
jgi:hypothetical protein